MAKADDPKNPELILFTLSRIEDGKTMEVQASTPTSRTLGMISMAIF
jgi:hypothetical protein